MATTLVPRTQKLPAEVHLRTLHPQIRSAFDDLMNQADAIDNPGDLPHYKHLHEDAARAIHIQLPASGELARCTCEACWDCDLVFDAAHARTYTSYSIEFVQCPACADEHRIYSD